MYEWRTVASDNYGSANFNGRGGCNFNVTVFISAPLNCYVSNILFALQVLAAKLTSMNVLVIHVNKVERVRIKSMDLPAAARLDSQVDFLPVNQVDTFKIIYLLNIFPLVILYHFKLV